MRGKTKNQRVYIELQRKILFSAAVQFYIYARDAIFWLCM